ncbi:hypothetical protein MT418_006085 [Batrachochytrium dendrobatidis]
MSSQSRAVGAERSRQLHFSADSNYPSYIDTGILFSTNSSQTSREDFKSPHGYPHLLVVDGNEFPRSSLKAMNYFSPSAINSILVSESSSSLDSTGSRASAPKGQPEYEYKGNHRRPTWPSVYPHQSLQEKMQHRHSTVSINLNAHQPLWSTSSMLQVEEQTPLHSDFDDVSRQLDQIRSQLQSSGIASKNNLSLGSMQQNVKQPLHAWEVHGLPQKPIGNSTNMQHHRYSQKQQFQQLGSLEISADAPFKKHMFPDLQVTNEGDQALLQVISSSNSTLATPSKAPSEVGDLENSPGSQMKVSSLELLFQSRPNIPANAHFSVLKIMNISWDLTIQDVMAFFADSQIPMGHNAPYYHNGIHIILDRTTGKTLGECYVEFPTQVLAAQALRTHRRGFLKGRPVSVEPSTQDKLYHALFPNLRASLEQSQKRLDFQAEENISEGNSQSTLDQKSRPELVYMAREDIFMLLSSCKPSRTHPSKKSSRRPFENIISILSKVPWHRANLVPILQRDHLFEMAKLGTESLLFQTQRVNSNLNTKFLDTFVRAILCVPLFTEKQKLIVLATAHLKCPPELKKFVYMPVEPEAKSQTSTNFSSRVAQIQDYSYNSDPQIHNMTFQTLPVESLPSENFTQKHRSESLNDLKMEAMFADLENNPMQLQSLHRYVSARSSPVLHEALLQHSRHADSVTVPTSSMSMPLNSCILDVKQPNDATVVLEHCQSNSEKAFSNFQFDSKALKLKVAELEHELHLSRQQYNTLAANRDEVIAALKRKTSIYWNVTNNWDACAEQCRLNVFDVAKSKVILCLCPVVARPLLIQPPLSGTFANRPEKPSLRTCMI